MRISRLHCEAKLETGQLVVLAAAPSHYLVTVLRLKTGDKIQLFNARQGEFSGYIERASKSQVEVSILDKLRDHDPQSVAVHLSLGLSRGERMDYAIQKSTELGVASITPLYSQYGEVKIKQASRLGNKLRHWRQIAISASEQSGRLSIPEIHKPVAFAECLGSNKASCRLILDPRGDDDLTELTVNESIHLMIGPEGGFSAEELALALAEHYSVVSLGSRILRTETAPVVALSILQHLYGEL